MNHLIIFKCIFQLFLVFSSTNAYKITFKKPNPVSMGSNGPVEIKVLMDSYEEEDNWIESNLVRLEFNLANQKSWLLEIQNQSLGKTNYFSDRHFWRILEEYFAICFFKQKHITTIHKRCGPIFWQPLLHLVSVFTSFNWPLPLQILLKKADDSRIILEFWSEK